MTSATPPHDTTLDALLSGRLLLEQRRDGYRFTSDALLLAAFARPFLAGGASVLDVGAGVGVVGLTLRCVDPSLRLTLLERQPALAELCRRNAARLDARETPDGQRQPGDDKAAIHDQGTRFATAATPDDKRQPDDDKAAIHDQGTRFATAATPDEPLTTEPVRVVEADVRRAGIADRFDAVVMNPPYFEVGRGRLSPGDERAAARHELAGSIDELITACARRLVDRGVLIVCYPAERLPALAAALLGCGLRRWCLRPVAPTADQPANLLLVAARRAPAHHADWQPTLVLRNAHRAWTDAARAVFDRCELDATHQTLQGDS